MHHDMKYAETDVFIVGAGPVGLTMAIELSRRGVACRIVDRAVGTKPHSRAMLLQVRTLEILSAMGGVGAFLAKGRPLDEIEMYAYGRHLGRIQAGGVDALYKNPLTLGQHETEGILCERLADLGGSVEWRSEVIACKQDERCATLLLRRADGELQAVSARYVAGCDGAASFIREEAGIPFVGEEFPVCHFLQADVRLRWATPQGTNAFFIGDDAFLIALALPDGAVRLIVSGGDAVMNRSENVTIEDFLHLSRRISDTDLDVADVLWLSRYSVASRRAVHFRQGRIFLVGDAAHVHIPIGGQGMNTGMQDAFNLAWKLAAVVQNVSPETILESYAHERQPVAEALTNGTERVFIDLADQDQLFHAALRFLGPFALRLETFRKKVGTIISELGIVYPEGELIEDLGGEAGARAGARAPNGVAVQAHSLETVRLHQIFSGGGWTLLAFSGLQSDADHYKKLLKSARAAILACGEHLAAYLVVADAPPPKEFPWESPVLLDRSHRLHEAYGVENPFLYVIRPDWHIGFRGKPTDEHLLMAYLRRVFTCLTPPETEEIKSPEE